MMQYNLRSNYKQQSSGTFSEDSDSDSESSDSGSDSESSDSGSDSDSELNDPVLDEVLQPHSLLSKLVAESSNEDMFLSKIRDDIIQYDPILHMFVHRGLVDRNERSIVRGIQTLLKVCNVNFGFLEWNSERVKKTAFTALYHAVKLFNELKTHCPFSQDPLKIDKPILFSFLKVYFENQQPGFFHPPTMAILAGNLNMQIIQFAVWCGVEKCFYSLRKYDIVNPNKYDVIIQDHVIDKNKWNYVMKSYIEAMIKCFNNRY